MNYVAYVYMNPDENEKKIQTDKTEIHNFLKLIENKQVKITKIYLPGIQTNITYNVNTERR